MGMSWQLIVPTGEYPHPSGVTQVIDQAAVQAMAASFDKDQRVLVDYDHYSDLTDEQRAAIRNARVQLPSEAAGWIVAVKPDKVGLMGNVELTPEGEKAVAAGEYRFRSPVWKRADCEDAGTGRVRPMKLSKLGLTNEPNIRMPALMLNREGEEIVMGPALEVEKLPMVIRDAQSPKEKRSMDYKAKLLALLGLPADATDEAIQAAMGEMANTDAADEEAKKAAEAAALKAKEEAEAMKNRAESAEQKLAEAAKAAHKVKVEAALKEHEGVIQNRADVEEALTKDFDGTLKVLKGLKLATLPNRSDGGLPDGKKDEPELTGVARTAAAFAKN